MGDYARVTNRIILYLLMNVIVGEVT